MERTNGFQMLDDLARTKTIKKRQPIYLPGDPGEALYLVRKGRVKLSVTSESGREVTLAIVYPGDLFGEAEAFDGTPRQTQAEALDDVELGVVHRGELAHAMRQHPEVFLDLTRLFGSRLRRLQCRVQDFVLRDASARLANLLLDTEGPRGALDGGEARIAPRLTHQEIGNFIGCARETVSTLLGQFREQGIIRMNGRSIIIVNVDEVARIASESSHARHGRSELQVRSTYERALAG